jgi:lysyl-tRNA synthetase class 2
LPISVKNLRLRAKLLQAVRDFFVQKGYLEVETPLRLPNLVPEFHILPLESNHWFLQTSPELCMKRLLAAGLPQIFQICKCFRKDERGSRHLPELTMLEWYQAGNDYFALMDDCEELFRYIADQLFQKNSLVWSGQHIDLSAPWQRLSLAEAFDRYAPVSLVDAMAQDKFEEILVQFVEPSLGNDRPVFIYDYPLSLASLARPSKPNPHLAERVELYVAGLELANGFSELVDSVEQRRRFELERKMIKESGREPGSMPEKFLADLDEIKEAAGIAMGVDRLVMLFADCQEIDGVVTFVPEEL